MEKTIEKDKASELAEQKMAELNAQEEQRIAEESKGASEEKSSTEEDEKTEGSEEEKKAEKSKEEVREDSAILEVADDELNEAEKTRKEELVKAKEDAKTPEEKLKDWQENVQKRIDGITGELKAEKDGRTHDAETIKTLEETIANLKGELENSGSIESLSSKDVKTDEERYVNMVSDDKDLPREKRREMSESELEEFLLENYTKANEWIVRREFRRQNERAERTNSRKVADNIDAKAKTFFADYPECDAGFKEQKRLVDGGMSETDALEKVSADNKDYALMMEIFKEDKKYSDPTNGPDLMAVEMKKRKESKAETKETYTKEEVDQLIKAEKDRQANIDTGITNSSADSTNAFDDPIVKEQWKAWVMASKRPSAVKESGDWSKKAFLETLKHGEVSGRR